MLRPLGNGRLRVGTPIELRDDIYCMAFLSQLRPDIITRYIDLRTGETIMERDERKSRELAQMSSQSSSELAD
jgi:uncharacterized membrane-anchored protein